MPRIHWTDDERRVVIRTAKDIKAKDKKISFARMMELAQLPLPIERRRHMKAIKGQNAELLRGLAAEGLIELQADAPATKVDPNLLRINQLADERDRAVASLALADLRIGELNEELVKLKAMQKSEAEVVKGFISDILASALVRVEDTKKPASLRLGPELQPTIGVGKEDLPDFERERRRDPTPTKTGNGHIKVKVAILGGENADHQAINREVKAVREDLDLRFFGADIQGGTKIDALRQIISTGGRAIVWTDHIRHSTDDTLKNLRVSYERYSGNLSGLIEKVKGTRRIQT